VSFAPEELLDDATAFVFVPGGTPDFEVEDLAATELVL